jgi:hypothetical protein
MYQYGETVINQRERMPHELLAATPGLLKKTVLNAGRRRYARLAFFQTLMAVFSYRVALAHRVAGTVQGAAGNRRERADIEPLSGRRR